MKLPKIGDIVHYYSVGEKIHPAMVLENLNDQRCSLLIYYSDRGQCNLECSYSVSYRASHWSWPEEEKKKPCRYGHDYYIPDCKSCWPDKEENPKECEHVYYHNGQICQGCGFDRKQTQSKAEDLIEKIWEILHRFNDNQIYSTLDFYVKTLNLIKEYKGIK
jgi:hypothetical protein